MTRALAFGLLVFGLLAAGCSSELAGGGGGGAVAPVSSVSAPSQPVATAPVASCRRGQALTVHFYDVGQALAVLVDLPGGRHVLVDAGDSPRRSGCATCEAEHAHLLTELRRDLAGAPLDLVWNTHPHSDHVGGVASVINELRVLTYVDNGRGAERPEVRAAREAASRRGTTYLAVDPEQVATATPRLALLGVRPVVPAAWPASCAHDENECSIGLRIEHCDSSVLFTGDAERDEEAHLDPLGPATLLQVGHHGSDTSTSERFLRQVAPRYAVVSAGHPDDERNREYCHPRALAMRRLSHALAENGGGGENAHLEAYEGTCKERPARADSHRGGWVDLPVSGRLFATERDGDVVLTTRGDGRFSRR